jgi:hypothetical protein
LIEDFLGVGDAGKAGTHPGEKSAGTSTGATRRPVNALNPRPDQSAIVCETCTCVTAHNEKWERSNHGQANHHRSHRRPRRQ